ncbi:synaptotagmin-5 [Selaginella moellendorffii]|nr:synaptotagmin-5 [Selaginella moellendorffii]|eukprot:XP_002961839.2 synaptotagmin-5 [Selaginella moellendorffii]
MALISGFIVGFIVGITLVLGFVLSENRRSHSRQRLAIATSALSKLSLDDLRKVFSNYKQPMPPWIVFSQSHKVSWMNQELRRIWPYVDQAASELARTIVEPILDQYKPPLISSLKFDKFTLGTVAPQFVGIDMVDDMENEVVMEIELEWDGNPSIILGVTTSFGVSLPIQVKNAAFAGIFRVIFKPLVKDLPCFGAIVYSLRRQKKLDFTLKVIGGDIKSVPGLAGAIDEMIKTAITDSLLWPVRQIIPIVPGDYSNLELRVVGTLHVKLVQAKDLLNKDLAGKSDPFARTFIRPIPSRMKRSKTQNNDLHPIWNEKYIFDVEDPSTQQLTVQVFDDEGVQASEFIGGALFPLKNLEPGVLKDVWLTLVKDLDNVKEHKYRGQVQVELLYHEHGTVNPYLKRKFPMTSLETMMTNSNGHPQQELQASPGKTLASPRRMDTSPQSFQPSHVDLVSPRIDEDDEFNRGVLTVTVIRAENLIAADTNGLADPYAVLRMKKSDQKIRTKVLNKTLQPEWNQTFDFVVEDAIHDMLIVEIWDHDTFGKDYMGRCALTLSRVVREEEYEEGYQLDGVKSGKIFLHMKWTSQPLSAHFGKF